MKSWVGKIILVLSVLFFMGCKKNDNSLQKIEVLDEKEISHSWFYFSEHSFVEIDLPQYAPGVFFKPWTEAVRISSASPVINKGSGDEFDGYAVVNRLGMLAFKNNKPVLFYEDSVFGKETADSLVFNGNIPVFYLTRNTFFNEGILKLSDTVEKVPGEQNMTVENARNFLMQFNPESKLCFPVVSYENVSLSENDQITGFFWNGKKWFCSAKKLVNERIDFSYFSFEPTVPLTDLSPALNSNLFTVNEISENSYRRMITLRLYKEAPVELKKLFANMPDDFPFYIEWRDSENSPVCYYNEGNGDVPANACGVKINSPDITAALFEDGTAFINCEGKTAVFRLPKLPAGYLYGDFSVSKKALFAAWEEKKFYETGRAGFLYVNLKQIMSKIK